MQFEPVSSAVEMDVCAKILNKVAIIWMLIIQVLAKYQPPGKHAVLPVSKCNLF